MPRGIARPSCVSLILVPYARPKACATVSQCQCRSQRESQFMNTSLLMPRLMYLLAGLAWVGLLWPSPTPVFLAGCLACLSMPLYRALRKYARRMRRRTELNLKLFLATNPGPAVRFVHVRRQRIKLALLHSFPIAGSFAVIFVSIALPISISWSLSHRRLAQATRA